MSQEFHYRLPRRVGGWRPGSHRGSSFGAGLEFVSHMSLYDRPDPRRLDLRASLRHTSDDWLVRVNRQRVGIPVHVLVDVSASMAFGAPQSKLQIIADFVEALGQSAFRVGDALGLLAFDEEERPELFMPALLSRGMGSVMATELRRWQSRPARGKGGLGLADAALHLAGRRGLVFLVSDFHWDLAQLSPVLDLLVHAHVVPMIVWDAAEIEPPLQDAIAPLQDMESGRTRCLWLRPKLRQQWRDGVARRRAQLAQFFAARGVQPFFVCGAFDGEALSQYFFETAA
jgi:uncharacterized protein (DUF58 family)